MIKQSMRHDQKMDEDIILHEFTLHGALVSDEAVTGIIRYMQIYQSAFKSNALSMMICSHSSNARSRTPRGTLFVLKSTTVRHFPSGRYMRRALLPPSLRTSTLCLSANSCNARSVPCFTV